jgi:hypothetical protein
MELLEAYGLLFEDYADDEYSTWSYICKEHSEKVPFRQLDEAGESDCLCGVEGCENTSSYYVDFTSGTMIRK